MSTVPIVASVADIPAAIRLAERNHGSRSYVARRIAELGRPEAIPASWGLTAAGPSAEARDKAADKGQALPDGSFPIRNRAELGKAIKAYGRAKNKAEAKRHIIKRARALGAFKDLPDDWDTVTSSGAKVMSDALTAALAPMSSEGAGALGEELLAEALRTGVAVEVGLRDDGAILFDLAPGYVAASGVTAAGWDPSVHPRGRDGKYIEKFGLIYIFEGKGFSKPSFAGEAIGVKRNDTGDYITVKATSAGKAPGGKHVNIGDEVQVRSSDIASAPPTKAKVDAGREKFIPGDTVRYTGDDVAEAKKGQEFKVSSVADDGTVTADDGTQIAPGKFEMARRQAREGENEVGVPDGETPDHPSQAEDAAKLTTGAAKWAVGDTVRDKETGEQAKVTQVNAEGVMIGTGPDARQLKSGEFEMVRRVKRDGEKTEGPSKMPTQSIEERTIKSPKTNTPGKDQPKLDEASSAQLDKELRDSLDALGINPDAPDTPEGQGVGAPVSDDEFDKTSFAVENLLFEKYGVDTSTNPQMLEDLIGEEMAAGNNDPESIAAKANDQIGFPAIGQNDDAPVDEHTPLTEADMVDVADEPGNQLQVPDAVAPANDLAGLSDDELKSRLMDAAVNGDTEQLTAIAGEISARKLGATKMGGPEDTMEPLAAKEMDAAPELDLSDAPEYDGSAHDNLDTYRTPELTSDWTEGDPDPESPRDFAKAILAEAVDYQSMNLDDDVPDADPDLDNYMGQVREALLSDNPDAAEDPALELRAYLIEEGYSEDHELPNPPEGGPADNHGIADDVLDPEQADLAAQQDADVAEAMSQPIPEDIAAQDAADNLNPVAEIEEMLDMFSEGSDDPSEYSPEEFAAMTKAAEDAGRDDLVKALDGWATEGGVYDDGNDEGDSPSSLGGPLPTDGSTGPTPQELEADFPTIEDLNNELASAKQSGDDEWAGILEDEIARREDVVPNDSGVTADYNSYEDKALAAMRDVGVTDEQINELLSSDSSPMFADDMDSGVDPYEAGKAAGLELVGQLDAPDEGSLESDEDYINDTTPTDAPDAAFQSINSLFGPASLFEERPDGSKVYVSKLGGHGKQKPYYVAVGPDGSVVSQPQDSKAKAWKEADQTLATLSKPTVDVTQPLPSATAPSTGSPHEKAIRTSLANSASNKGLDIDVNARLDEAFAKDPAEAHKDIAKLMTELKLGGKQRKRMRELTDAHFGGDSSGPLAKATADNLSDDNPLKAKLAAAAESIAKSFEGSSIDPTPDQATLDSENALDMDAAIKNLPGTGEAFTPSPESGITSEVHVYPDGSVRYLQGGMMKKLGKDDADKVKAEWYAASQNDAPDTPDTSTPAPDQFVTEPLVRTDGGYTIAGVGFKKNASGEWVDEDGNPGVRSDIVERLQNEAAKDAIRDKIAQIDSQIAEVDKKLTPTAPSPAAPVPDSPKPTENVADVVSDFPAPQPGAKVYEHPMGAKIYVNPDGSMEAYGKDGKKKKTSATPEKLAAGHGTWVETTGQATPAQSKPAPKPIPPGNPEAALDAIQDVRGTNGNFLVADKEDDYNLATAVRYLGYAMEETGSERQKSIDVASKTLSDTLLYGSLTDEQRDEVQRILDALQGKA